MHKSKRDLQERAYKQGYIEGLKHHSDIHCPQSLAKRAQWLAGFRRGRYERMYGVFSKMTYH